MNEKPMRLVDVHREDWQNIGHLFTLSFKNETNNFSIEIITPGPILPKYFTEHDRHFALAEILEDFKEQI